MAKRSRFCSASVRVVLEESYVDAKGKTKWRPVGSVDRRLWRLFLEGSPMHLLFPCSGSFARDAMLLEEFFPWLFSESESARG